MLLNTPFEQMPLAWQISLTIVNFCGVLVCLILLAAILKPFARGWSHGIYETILYYRAGADLGRVFTRFLFALLIEPFVWLGKSTTTSITNDKAGWYGIFSWRYDKDLNRKASKIENAKWKAERAAARQKAMDDDV